MSVWYCIPSARPPEEAEICLKLWREMGYRIALWRECSAWDLVCDLRITRAYPGYAAAVNELIAAVLSNDPECDWVVTGGDDTEPDLAHTADEIAQQCSEHFGQLLGRFPLKKLRQVVFGVMQPTGDRFAGGCIDRICGSPWLGREWCQRINQGRGPLWPEYTHMYADEELQEVAQKYGVLWQRRDLIHLHHQFKRESAKLDSNAINKPIPAFLAAANSASHWVKYGAMFRARKLAGFPGSEPL